MRHSVQPLAKPLMWCPPTHPHLACSLLLLSLAVACRGDAPTDAGPPPIEDPPPGFLRFASVSAGHATACGLLATGGTYCWGAMVGSDRPLLLAGAPPFTSIDVHAMWALLLCGLDANGTAHCHRRGAFATVAASSPWTALAAGTANCARTATGETWCWTYDTGAGVFSGVLGDGGANTDGYVEGTAVAVAGGHAFDVLTSSYLTACAITPGGSAYCWGQNPALSIGDGSASGEFRLSPSPVAGGHVFAAISLSPSHACAIDAGDRAWCWGASFFGQLGNPAAATVDCPGYSPGECAPAPVAVSGDRFFTAIAAGGDHSCALDHQGRAYCWGSNAWGQLGNGRRGGGMTERTPVPVAGALAFRSITAGDRYTCAIATNDATYCWGMNQAGQLGAGLHPGHVSTVPHPVGVP